MIIRLMTVLAFFIALLRLILAAQYSVSQSFLYLTVSFRLVDAFEASVESDGQKKRTKNNKRETTSVYSKSENKCSTLFH